MTPLFVAKYCVIFTVTYKLRERKRKRREREKEKERKVKCGRPACKL
jgi:hypothetical protein